MGAQWLSPRNIAKALVSLGIAAVIFNMCFSELHSMLGMIQIQSLRQNAIFHLSIVSLFGVALIFFLLGLLERFLDYMNTGERVHLEEIKGRSGLVTWLVLGYVTVLILFVIRLRSFCLA
jgi:hypothetical protein